MPKLPTEADLGPSPSLESRRGIASYDVSPVARGQQAIASGLLSIGGAGVNTGLEMIARENRQAETLQDAQAQADLLTASAKRRSQIGDATDAAELEKIHREGAQADLEAAANRITDPNRRALFLERARPTIETLGTAAKDKAFNITSDQTRASTLQKLEELKKTAINDQDPEKKAGYIDAGNALISGMEKEGYITAVQAQQQREAWGRSYAVDALNAMNPQARLAAARGGWEGALIQRESSNNPRIVNGLGYTGLYQFGAPLLKTLGLYTPGAGENLQTWSTTKVKDDPTKWSGSFNIPGFPGVRTLSDFRENPEAQRAAFQASTAYYDKEIDRRGLGKFIGQTVNGVPITREGIYTAAHLGGIAGTDSWLRGGADRGDANGSKISQYARMAAQAGPGAGDPNERSLARYLDPQQRLALANGATRDLVNQDRAAQNAQANEAATVRSLMKDDEASIMAQGAPLATITPERVSASLGPAAAEQFAQSRAQAVQFHDATNDWSQIPLEEIRARLVTLRPAPGAQGFEAAQRLFSVAEDQAAKIQKERQQDPAAAADRTPEVRAALQNATLDRPDTYQAVAKARAIAQERLRIPEDLRVPMTRAEAQQVARPLELAQQGGDPREIRDVLTDTVKQLQTAFGDQSDTALQQVIKEAHIGRAGAEMAAVVLRKLANREMPTPQDARALDQAQQTSAADRAVAGVAPAAPATGGPLPLNFDATAGATGTDYLNPQPAVPARPTFPTPDAGAIDMLRKKPDLARQFDRTYGPGASERVLAITGRP